MYSIQAVKLFVLPLDLILEQNVILYTLMEIYIYIFMCLIDLTCWWRLEMSFIPSLLLGGKQVSWMGSPVFRMVSI